ncbi:MAG: tetratricopeptide repeat protein [Planctomycetes bacterium]|nr:tetratricopeptide repeat protein [Planctomycetota bacterium]
MTRVHALLPALALAAFLIAATGCNSVTRPYDKPTGDWTPEEYYELGQLYYQRGSYDPSEAEFRKALSLRPDYAEAQCGLGYVYLQRGNIESQAKNTEGMNRYHNLSRKYFLLALESKSSLAEPHYGLGMLYFGRNRPDEAIQEFETYLTQDRRRAETCFYLGTLYSLRERYEEALTQFRRYLELNPTPPQAQQLYDTIERLEYLTGRGEGLGAASPGAGVARTGIAPPSAAPRPPARRRRDR